MILQLCRECLGDATHSTGAFDFPDVCARCLNRMTLCGRTGHRFKTLTNVRVDSLIDRLTCSACGHMQIEDRPFLRKIWGFFR